MSLLMLTVGWCPILCVVAVAAFLAIYLLPCHLAFDVKLMCGMWRGGGGEGGLVVFLMSLLVLRSMLLQGENW